MAYVFTTISDGRLISKWDGEEIFNERATKKNGIKLGQLLAKLQRERGDFTGMYSSSIDFPQDSGGPRVNFRAAISLGYEPNQEVYDPINGGERP